jgi:pyrroloquinoline quinone (PQQ) biosynthesis protein C
MFGAREVQMSRDLIKNIVDECNRLGKKDWAEAYKKQTEAVGVSYESSEGASGM